METPRRHQNSLSSFPKREIMQGFSKDTIPKSPLLFYTPLKKPCPQLAKQEDGERHTSVAKENPKATENLLVARINGANVRNYSCSTPIKTPFGTPSQLQTPTSKLSFLSASGNKHSVGAGACGITRTPFTLLAGKNLNLCLFSPSHPPRPITSPAPFDNLASPSLKGHAKRVLLMPSQLSPARRVPVKQKRSQSTTTEKQLPFVTPKSSRVDNVQSVTPKFSRGDNVSKVAGQNSDDGNVMQHHDVRNFHVNYNKKNLEGLAWPRRVLASQSPFATPNSSRLEHVLKTAGQNNGVSGGKMMQHHDPDVKHGRAKLNRLELLLASMPQVSSPARRVPVRQKTKQPTKSSSPLHHKEKKQSSNKKPFTETPKTSKSSQNRKKTCQNEAGVQDSKRQAAGSHQQKSTKKLLKRVPKGKERNGTDKAKQQNVDNHEIKGGNSKQHDEDINKKCGDDSVDDNGNVQQHCEKGKQHEAADVDVCQDEHRDAEYGGDDKSHGDDEDDTKHHHADVFGDDGKCHFDKGRDDEKQHEDSHVDVGGADVTKKPYRDGSKHYPNDNGMEQHDRDDGNDGKQHVDSHVDIGRADDTKERYRDRLKHYEYDNGTEQHDHDGGDDDNICIRSSDDMDGEKQHGDDNTAKQHDHSAGVKQHNDDSTQQHDDDKDDIDRGGEEVEFMKHQHDNDVDISTDDDDKPHHA